jgi:hypothetical protein
VKNDVQNVLRVFIFSESHYLLGITYGRILKYDLPYTGDKYFMLRYFCSTQMSFSIPFVAIVNTVLNVQVSSYYLASSHYKRCSCSGQWFSWERSNGSFQRTLQYAIRYIIGSHKVHKI